MMLGRFDLHIDLGNDAMSGPADVALALRKVADELEADPWNHPKPIRDLNGNTVGEWKVEAV